MALAGRCQCGLRLDLAAQYPDDHLACRGEKRCRQCKLVKPRTEFSQERASCKPCRAKSQRERYNSDPIFRRAILDSNLASYYNHKLERLETQAERYKRTHQRECESHQRYYQKHRDRLRKRQNDYHSRNRAVILAKKRAKYAADRQAQAQKTEEAA